MKVYGLTGGIGMGKSTSEKLLGDEGISVIDTDTISRQLVEPGQPALTEIKSTFGENIVDAGGRLRRAELAKIVFGDSSARQRLEQILHPRIREVWLRQIASWRAKSKPVAVVVIPLLYETQAAAQFDEIICLACSAATQTTRLRSRGWDQAQIGQRISAQWPIEKKMSLAHRVVWTEGDLTAHREQLHKILG